MKIVSLLPSATEIVCALGLEDSLVAVTHECDYPPSVKKKPVITQSMLPEGLTSAEIDAAVREQLAGAHSLYTIDQTLLAELAPDLILTQQLCDVCAVSYDDVLAAVRSLLKPPRVLNLQPTTLTEVLGTITQVGQSTGREGQAAAVVASLQTRIDRVRVLSDSEGYRPRTVLLEWIDPLFGGGHWDPELVQIAGGYDALGSLHQPSTQISWDGVREFASAGGSGGRAVRLRGGPDTGRYAHAGRAAGVRRPARRAVGPGVCGQRLGLFQPPRPAPRGQLGTFGLAAAPGDFGSPHCSEERVACRSVRQA